MMKREKSSSLNKTQINEIKNDTEDLQNSKIINLNKKMGIRNLLID